MTSWIHRTIIVPAAFQQLAQGLCAAAAEGDAGVGMFTTGLSETGTEPATHYISSGLIAPEFAHMLPEQVWEQDEDGAWVQTGSTPGNHEAVHAVCTAAGMELTLAQVEAIFTVSDVTEHEPFVAMGRLGLVQSEAVE